MLPFLLLAQAVTALNDSNPYVPKTTTCPSNLTFIRTADSVSPGESDFLQKRDAITREALIDWLGDSNLTDFDASDFLSNQTIRIGLAYSGGGYRAMFCGAGQLAALDNRTNGSTATGHVGGLLQASTYLAGLSGGNWLVGTIAINNFTSVQDILTDGNLWDLTHSMLNPGGINIFETFGYWDTIIDDVEAKQDAGWNVSLTDLWGRGIGYQTIDAANGGEGYAYTNIRNHPVFEDAEMPFPIHVTDRREIGETLISLNSSVFEFNPFEIGSWDPNVYHFADLKYLGTLADNGQVDNSSNCTYNYDNAGFLMGTSATLFNEFLLDINSTDVLSAVKSLATDILDDMASKHDDISLINPSPFYGLDGTSDSEYELLTLVDGGEDGENIPLVPLYQPQRAVDVIFAFDNSADTDDYWPNGTSMVATYERQFGDQANGTHFPYVPDQEAFWQAGLVGQPTFFGCNLSNLTSLYGSNLSNATFEGVDPSNIPPVIVYIGNSEHSYRSNIDTFQLSYSDDERDAVIRNGYETMTQNNGSLDSNWRSALGCAIILREQQRRNQTPTEQCQSLLKTYCWDGSTVVSDLADNGTNFSAPIRRDGKNNLVANSTAYEEENLASRLLNKKALVVAGLVGAVAAVL